MRMRLPVMIWAVMLLLSFSANSLADESIATIHVQADRHTGQISPYAVGACIEDVNHEIYGGLYSQMVFGENFNEPPVAHAPKGFVAYGGDWLAKEGELQAAAGDGPKLILDDSDLTAGEVSVEIRFADRQPGNAGLILKVDQPATGADRFSGYEVALYPENGTLLLGRHRQNWEPLKIVPCEVPIGKWIKLTVRLEQESLEVTVDDRSLIRFEDRDHPLASGKVGLRTWKRAATFRDLRVTGGAARLPSDAVPFADNSPDADSVSGMWTAVKHGSAQGRLTLENDRPFAGSQSQRITLTGGEGLLGVANQGLNRWGMHFVAGKPYEGYVWTRAKEPIALQLALQTGDGRATLAAGSVAVAAEDWQRYDFTLTPSENEANGRFALAISSPGAVDLGHVFLQPGPWGRFKGLPVRKDVADALVAEGLTVLRYGGSMINHPEYRWKKMIGLRDRRPPYQGTWYPYSTNGWGIIDFLNFCEAAGFLAIPDFNIDETPQDMVDFVAYVNGPADSEWGRRRAADGHPAPYQLRYLELGNEEAVNETYWQKFKPIAEALWRADAGVTLIVGDFAYGQHIADPYHFAGAPLITSLAAHKQILDLAHEHQRPIWFDVHISNDSPRECDGQLVVLAELIGWLGKLSSEADFKVCIFEENSGNHLWRRGLAHARTVSALERFADRVPIVCAANCLQPDGQNDNGWDQGLLFLNPAQVWGQPSYYVTQLIAEHNLPHLVQSECQSPQQDLDVTARTSKDGQTLVLQVTNSGAQRLVSQIELEGFSLAGKRGQAFQIAAALDEANTPTDPQRVTSWQRAWDLEAGSARQKYVFPSHSFTLLCIEPVR